MKKYRLISTFSIFLSTLLLAACGTEPKAENEIAASLSPKNQIQLNAAELKNTPIVSGKMESRSLSTNFKVSGLIDVPPQNLISVSIPLGGFLKSTKLMPGMHIFKGETIAVMEDQQYIQLQQDYLTTEAKLKYAEAEFNRQRDLNLSKAASDKAFQQAEAEFKSLKIEYRSLSEKLQLIGINPLLLTENNLSRSVAIPSPIDGYVSAVHVNIGKYVNPSDVLFELVNPEDIHLALTVFEKDIDKLFIGQTLLAYSNSNPDTKYPCEIILIGKDLSAERSVEVHCHFDKFDKKLLPGMFMNAEIDVNKKNTFAIPEEAVVNFEGKNYVFIAKGNNQFQLLEAETGILDKAFIELKNAENFRDKQIVFKGAYNLLMKMKNISED